MSLVKELRNYDWLEAFSVAKVQPVINARDIDLTGISPETVAEVIAIKNGANDGESWTGVFRLFDGRYISVCSWCDYTGWGCQDGGEIFVGRDKESVIRFGLSEQERARLNLTLAEK
jgi:hypothetical protein